MTMWKPDFSKVLQYVQQKVFKKCLVSKAP